MINSKLSHEANLVLAEFLRLPDLGVKCPYFTNERQKVRGALRVQVGKGSAEEIVEEALLIAHKSKVELAKLSPENKTKFLVDHNLGIDCSGFVYYILEAEGVGRGYGHLVDKLSFPKANNVLSIIRKLFVKRPVENMSVAVFADASNSRQIKINEARAGDFFVINKYAKQTGTPRNHIMVIIKIENGEIEIAQSVALPEDGRYGHGVRIEQIDSSNPPGELRRLNWF